MRTPNHTVLWALNRSLRRSGAAALVAFGAFTTAGVAFADPYHPTDEEKAAARPLAIDGIRMAQSGDCHGAIDRLSRAEALVHAPTVALPLAQCEIQLGKIVAGTELLNRVSNDQIPAGAPQSWIDAKTQARAALDAAEPRIPKLRIHVEVPAGVSAHPDVTVDGQPLPSVLLDNERPTDPGTHHIVAVQGGLGSAETDVSLTEGQVREVSLTLGAAVAGPANAPPAAADPYGSAATPAAPTAPAGTSPYAANPGSPWNAFEFGLRLPFGIPFGGAGAGVDLNHVASFMFAPIYLDAGFRLASNWYVGSYFSYGLISVSNQAFGGDCAGGTMISCSANDIRWGVDGAFHVLPDNFVDPWFGLDFGYEWLSISESEGAATGNAGLSGWEFVGLQTGVDFHLLKGALGIGPFFSVTFDEYSHASKPTDTMGDTTGGSVNNQAFHEWFMFGARGSYDLKFQ